jgi:hypothetical protein
MARLSISRLNRQRRSGDACECPKCRGVLVVYTTRVEPDEGIRTRYLWCNLCHSKPEDNKIIVPLEFAPPRNS